MCNIFWQIFGIPTSHQHRPALTGTRRLRSLMLMFIILDRDNQEIYTITIYEFSLFCICHKTCTECQRHQPARKQVRPWIRSRSSWRTILFWVLASPRPLLCHRWIELDKQKYDVIWFKGQDAGTQGPVGCRYNVCRCDFSSDLVSWPFSAIRCLQRHHAMPPMNQHVSHRIGHFLEAFNQLELSFQGLSPLQVCGLPTLLLSLQCQGRRTFDKTSHRLSETKWWIGSARISFPMVVRWFDMFKLSFRF